MSACANCAPKCGRFSAYILAHFVCIAPRAFYQTPFSRGLNQPLKENSVYPSPIEEGVLGVFDKNRFYD